MIKTSLEVECNECGHKFWYNGEKKYPDTINCTKCKNPVEIPEI
jgi:DNA-directed RNA polymerase subunit RPC12/RpoP